MSSNLKIEHAIFTNLGSHGAPNTTQAYNMTCRLVDYIRLTVSYAA